MSHSRDRIGHERQTSGKGRTDWKKTAIRVCGAWSEQMSSKGKVYYYNCDTEVSQWQRPKDWSLPDLDGSLIQASYNARVRRQSESRSTSQAKRLHENDGNEVSNKPQNTDNSVCNFDQGDGATSNKRPRIDFNTNTPSRSHGFPSHSETPSHNSKYESQHSNSSSNQPTSTHLPYSSSHNTGNANSSRNTHHNTSNAPSRSSHACNNDDMDISPGSSPLSGKSGSDSIEASPSETFTRSNSQRATTLSTSQDALPPVSQKRPCTEEDLVQVVNSLLTTIASLFSAGDDRSTQKPTTSEQVPPNNNTYPNLLHSLQSALLSYSKSINSIPVSTDSNPPLCPSENSASTHTSLEQSSSNSYIKSNSDLPIQNSSAQPLKAADRLYMQLEEVLCSAQVSNNNSSNSSACSNSESSAPTFPRLNGERHDIHEPPALYANSQLQKLLLRLKQRPPSLVQNGSAPSSSTSQSSISSTSGSVPLTPQAILESLVSGLTQVAGALNNSVPSKNLPAQTPSNRGNSSLTSDSTALNQSLENNHSGLPRTSLVRSFSPVVLPPVTAASLSIKEVPSPEDINRCNSTLTSVKMSRYVDPLLMQKYCDPLADRLVREALLEQQKFDKLQSVLYGELCCESKTLRALVRIPEIQASLYQLKLDLANVFKK